MKCDFIIEKELGALDRVDRAKPENRFGLICKNRHLDRVDRVRSLTWPNSKSYPQKGGTVLHRGNTLSNLSRNSAQK